jgi:hypothetical protein
MALRLFIHLIYHVKLFCQTGLGNSFSFTEKADREAETQKNIFTGEAKLCQTRP